MTYSARTTRPIRPQLHRYLMEHGVWKPGDVNADIGGGKYDIATEYLAEHGVTNYVWDPGNRSEDRNRAVLRAILDDSHGRTAGADTATIANVLNVIPTLEERLDVLRRAANAVKPGGAVYIWVHCGDMSGVGKPTRDGWQENRKTASYMPEVEQVFQLVERRGRVICGALRRLG